ncbi:MmcQ/YjbR family DNA-binding protein [Arvimicrobium flavum]|uniref:MmcQ/YjbR family DNA-binding protein n=1 Tax=Arvimicrobium flavum TaxID=3393320 RepID=UPI00237A5205|nr:MmcQ/YjbR family DNA-binding protein [Mesorhizobium shangrilense]
MPDDTLAPAFDKLRRAAAGLPNISEGTSYGTPSLRAGKKFLARVKDADTVAVMCPLEEKEVLLAAAPEFYFETDHYRGWPAMLVRVHDIPIEELAHRLERAWQIQATPKMLKARGPAGRSGG